MGDTRSDFRTVNWQAVLWLTLILVGASWLRLTALDWDRVEHYHPDERYIAWVGTTIEFQWPESVAAWRDPQGTTLNPFYWPEEETTRGVVVPRGEPRRFAYGHVPLYLGVGFTRLIEQISPWMLSWLPEGWAWGQLVFNADGRSEFEHLTLMGRLLTGIFDLGTVLLTFLLGRRLGGTAVGLFAAAGLALTVMHIQLAHFFTSDPYLTFFAVASLWGMVEGITRERRRAVWLGLAAVMLGLAVGSKFSAILLAFPLFLSVIFGLRRRVLGLFLTAGVAFTVFALTNPYALLDNSCELISPPLALGVVDLPALNWGNCYLDNVLQQSGMVRGGSAFPFVRQYEGTQPFIYPLEMQLRWGMGYFLGGLGLLGFGWVVLASGGALVGRWMERPLAYFKLRPELLILLAWAVPFFITTARFYVKFMRYLQPLIPLWIIFGGLLLWQIRPAWLRRTLAMGVLLPTALYALAFVNLYRTPHPWYAASEWIYANVPAGAQIVTESWDQSLPSSITIDGEPFRRRQYSQAELSWLTGTGPRDSAEKLRLNALSLSNADYLVVASNRIYNVVPRLPEEYPLSHAVHPLLFEEELGYELVYVAGRMPNLMGIGLFPDYFEWADVPPPGGVEEWLADQPKWIIDGGRTDESFTVYDQPLVMIFANRDRLALEEIEQRITARAAEPNP